MTQHSLWVLSASPGTRKRQPPWSLFRGVSVTHETVWTSHSSERTMLACAPHPAENFGSRKGYWILAVSDSRIARGGLSRSHSWQKGGLAADFLAPGTAGCCCGLRDRR